jgi:chaperonin GroES
LGPWISDGYAEPYIVTFERNTGKVLRVCARFDDKCIHMITDDKGKEKLAKIDAIQYYTKYGFIPNPEGGFYDIGFGLLLSPLNESVNTLINQLIDSGTIATYREDSSEKGLSLRWESLVGNPANGNLFKQPPTTYESKLSRSQTLRTKSDVLFKLMGTLITGAKELASIAEIFTGKMPGQNTPATTTMATVEQGMKVFTAVYKRVYRSLKSEFKKLFDLNSVYLDPTTISERC